MGEKNGYLPYPKGFATDVCHFAQEPEQWSSSAIVPPISTSVGYKFLDVDQAGKFIVSPWGNPNRNILEKVLANAENGKYGACFASGCAALSTCLAMLNQNEHVIAVNDIYGGTRKLLRALAARYNIETTFVDSEPECFERAVQPSTKMIFIETPTNPSLKVVDIEAVSKVAKKHKLIFVVDNTFLSPYLQRPLHFGADIVMQSVSKYLNGHTDIIMGALITNNESLFEEIKTLQNALGNVPSPFDCSQVLRGLKTLPVRIRQQGKSSLLIAKFLESHDKVEKVIHPGLPSHPKYEVSKKQTSGYSGMITMYLKEHGLEATKKFVTSLKIITCAGSLGGYNSVIELPNRVSHASVPLEEKKKLNYTDNMLRMSIGLEDPEDLIEDLRRALAAI